MTSKIFDEVLDKHIKVFVEDFCFRSIELFKPSPEDRIFHNGEFGMHREQLVRTFLRKLIPTNLEIGTGFIINDKSDVSTQCDVIVYDKINTPLQDEIPFFPIETVVAIGEVKSTLDTNKLKDALKKLAKIKEFRATVSIPTVLRRECPIDAPNLTRIYIFKMADLIREHSGFSAEDEFWGLPLPKYSAGFVGGLESSIQAMRDFVISKPFDEDTTNKLLIIIKKLKYICRLPNISNYNIEHYHFDHITSFLICDKIDLKMNGKMEDLPTIINDWYDELDIKVEHRHNMILSLKDGLLLYYDPIDIDTKEPKFKSYPKVWNEPLDNLFFPCFDPLTQVIEIINTEISNKRKGPKPKKPRDLNDVLAQLVDGINIKIKEKILKDAKEADIAVVFQIIDNLIHTYINDSTFDDESEKLNLYIELSNLAYNLFQSILPKYEKQEHLRIFAHYIWLNSVDTTVLHTETAMYMSRINLREKTYHLQKNMMT